MDEFDNEFNFFMDAIHTSQRKRSVKSLLKVF